MKDSSHETIAEIEMNEIIKKKMTWAKMQLSVAEHLIKNRIDFIIAEGTECSTTTARYLCECCVS